MYFQNPKVLEGLTGYGNKTNYAQQPDLTLQCETLISLPTIDKETTVVQSPSKVMKKSKRDTNGIDMGKKPTQLLRICFEETKMCKPI